VPETLIVAVQPTLQLCAKELLKLNRQSIDKRLGRRAVLENGKTIFSKEIIKKCCVNGYET
jgi:hypothetical protein